MKELEEYGGGGEVDIGRRGGGEGGELDVYKAAKLLNG